MKNIKIVFSLFVSFWASPVYPPPSWVSLAQQLKRSPVPCEAQWSMEPFLTFGHDAFSFSWLSIKVLSPIFMILSDDPNFEPLQKEEIDRRLCFLSRSRLSWPFLYSVLVQYAWEKEDLERIMFYIELGLSGVESSVPLLHLFAFLNLLTEGDLQTSANAYRLLLKELPDSPTWILDMIQKLEKGENPLQTGLSREFCANLRDLIPSQESYEKYVLKFCP